MIAITITQDIKDQNELSENVGSIKTYRDYPNKFWNTERVVGGYANRTDLHEDDGFRDVVQPTYNTATQYKGAIFFDDVNDVFTYEVLDKTDEQIQNELVAESEARKQEIIQAQIVTNAEIAAQASDDDNSLEQQPLFPFWSGDGNEYSLGFKVQDFTIDNELALYKVVQAHTSQPNWKPRDVPALFTRIQLDVVLNWVQPTGAQDAYNIGDQVVYPDDSGIIYESTVDANVFAPLVVAGQWILV